MITFQINLCIQNIMRKKEKKNKSKVDWFWSSVRVDMVRNLFLIVLT